MMSRGEKSMNKSDAATILSMFKDNVDDLYNRAYPGPTRIVHTQLKEALQLASEALRKVYYEETFEPGTYKLLYNYLSRED